jgi:hypothetical protein
MPMLCFINDEYTTYLPITMINTIVIEPTIMALMTEALHHYGITLVYLQLLEARNER